MTTKTALDMHTLPRILSARDIERIIKECPPVAHHDDDGHHVGKEKPHFLAWVADMLWPHVQGRRSGAKRAARVDAHMRLYRLHAGAGEVHPHRDQDYKAADGSTALYSILLYLNKEYSGGETVFCGNILAPSPEVGGGLLFKHDILHEGWPVLSGEKFVLKTDLLF